MINITRRLAMQLRKVLRQALDLSTRATFPPIQLDAGPHGLDIRSHTGDAAVEFHLADDQPAQQAWVPGELLADVEGRTQEPVQIEIHEDHLLASWRDGSIPQMVRHSIIEPDENNGFPEPPANWAENSPELLKALHDAMETTGCEAIRYATNCVQLRGTSGEVVATDGRHLLIHNGFTFPWDEDVLVPGTRLFGCHELPQGQPVRIGKTDNWIAFGIGPWTIFRKLHCEGRYPDVKRHVSRPGSAASRLQLSPADAEFLQSNLARLPKGTEPYLPVTVDLNCQTVIRAKAAGQSQPTELVLRDSVLSGDPIRVNTNREYLRRALSLGFREICLYVPKDLVRCSDERRQYMWALLDPESALPPAKDAVRIESPKASEVVHVSNPNPSQKRANMPDRKPKQNGRPNPRHDGATENDKAEQDDMVSLIDRTEATRALLREAVTRTNDLVRALKRHRKRAKIVETKLASLREL